MTRFILNSTLLLQLLLFLLVTLATSFDGDDGGAGAQINVESMRNLKSSDSAPPPPTSPLTSLVLSENIMKLTKEAARLSLLAYEEEEPDDTITHDYSCTYDTKKYS
jgi:hypothetical protein